MKKKKYIIINMFFLLGQIISLFIITIINLLSTIFFSKERSYKIYKLLLKMIVYSPIINHKINITGNKKCFGKTGIITVSYYTSDAADE